MITWKKYQVSRAPGLSFENGKTLCPCAGWTRNQTDEPEQAFLKGETSSLPHAAECDGKGNYVGKRIVK